MNNIKFYFSFLLLIMLMLVFPSQALAATGEVTKTKTFTTTNKKFYYAFDEQITKDGKQYKLKNVDYKQIDKKAESEEKEVVKTKVYHYLYEKKCNPKQELTITRNGKQVQVSLNNIVYKSETIKGRYTYATAHTNYDYVTTKPTAPKTKKINYNDKYTGKTVSVNLPLKSFKSGDEKWINDVSIPMTCKKYDSDYYLLGNDILIPYNEESPAINGYESEILSMLELDSSKYKISSISWDGSSYTKNGIKYRKALAKGSRLASKYVATYYGKIDLPNYKGYKGIAYYKGKITVTNNDINYYTVRATAHYVLVEDVTQSKPKAVKQNNTIKYVFMGLGALLVVAFIVLVLFFIAKKRKTKKDLY